jgi:hypothetical protein
MEWRLDQGGDVRDGKRREIFLHIQSNPIDTESVGQTLLKQPFED